MRGFSVVGCEDTSAIDGAGSSVEGSDNSIIESEGAVCPCVRAPWGFNVGLLASGGSPAGSVEVKLDGVESFDGWDVCPASARVVCIGRREPHCVVVYDFLA